MFEYCDKLVAIKIPGTLEVIGKYAFADTDLKLVDFEGGSVLRTVSDGVSYLRTIASLHVENIAEDQLLNIYYVDICRRSNSVVILME